MLRALCYSVPALAVVVGGLVLAADSKPRDQEKGKRSPAPLGLPADVARFIKEHDHNNDGFLQREELPQEMRGNFGRIDTNKDGKLSPQELQRGFAYLQPQRRPSDLVFVLIEMSDCDECCAEELQRLYDVLRQMDKDRDGKIDPTELKAARERCVTDRVDVLMKALDRNKDGKISREEARGLIREHFDRIDRNGDGFINRQELTGAAHRPTSTPAGQEPLSEKKHTGKSKEK